jgi:hypothetical protein
VECGKWKVERVSQGSPLLVTLLLSFDGNAVPLQSPLERPSKSRQVQTYGRYRLTVNLYTIIIRERVETL